VPGLKIKELVADRGYGSAENLEKLEEINIETNIPLWSSISGKTFFKELEDVPDHHEIFSTTMKKQERPGFKRKLRERMWKMARFSTGPLVS
jgi:hypothetical protein